MAIFWEGKFYGLSEEGLSWKFESSIGGEEGSLVMFSDSMVISLKPVSRISGKETVV